MPNEPLTDRTGTCLCGAVTVTAKGCEPKVGACHCGMCRRWSGGPLMVVGCASLEIEGEEHVRTFAGSQWAERGFCDTCGANLFWRLRDGGYTCVSAGVLDPKDDVAFDHQVFIDEKPSWYAFANETKDMTAAEVFAMFEGTGD